MTRVNGGAPPVTLPGPQMHAFATNIAAGRMPRQMVAEQYGAQLKTDALALEISAGQLSIVVIVPIAAARPLGESIAGLDPVIVTAQPNEAAQAQAAHDAINDLRGGTT